MTTGTERLVIFDVCDTLYRENTTLGFVRFFHAGRTWFKAVDWLIGSRRSPLFYIFAIAYRVVGVDLPRAILLISLRGYSKSSLISAAQNYMQNRLSLIEIRETHEKLYEYQRAGDRIILVSNSIDIVVEAIADKIGVEWYASDLVYDVESCLGKTNMDRVGRKSEIAKKILEKYPCRVELVVFTDNLSDRDLLELANHPVIIIPRFRNKKSWLGFSAEYIELQ